ncbi:MAG: hypothetical protein ACRD3C_15025 [Vicinamibacterales bacterium]
MLKDLLDGEGDWWRAFNETNRDSFGAPAVTKAEYPKMGFSLAWNDETRGVLELESYAATSSASGDATRFTVHNLPDPARVRRDGRDYSAWRAIGSGSIEIETTVGTYAFEIVTGYSGPDRAIAGEKLFSGTHSLAPTAPAATRPGTTMAATMADVATAVSTLGARAAACPCCARLV